MSLKQIDDQKLIDFINKYSFTYETIIKNDANLTDFTLLVVGETKIGVSKNSLRDQLHELYNNGQIS
jgi:hypothetical protein